MTSPQRSTVRAKAGALLLACTLPAAAPGYELAHGLVPLFRSVSVEAHMGEAVPLLLAILAGLRLARQAAHDGDIRIHRLR